MRNHYCQMCGKQLGTETESARLGQCYTCRHAEPAPVELDMEERLELQAAAYRENMALSTMDPADRAYLEERQGLPDMSGWYVVDAPNWERCHGCGLQLPSGDPGALCRRCLRETDPAELESPSYVNYRSLVAIPVSLLPVGPARTELLELALYGSDCYGYAPLQLEEEPLKRRYNVWAHGRRYSVQDWLEAYDLEQRS